MPGPGHERDRTGMQPNQLPVETPRRPGRPVNGWADDVDTAAGTAASGPIAPDYSGEMPDGRSHRDAA